MKRALVTGANGGFGQLIVLELLKEGFHVIASMRNINNQKKLVENAKELGLNDRLEVIELNVVDTEQVAQVSEYLKKTYPCLDVLVNNAGYSQGGFIDDLEMQEWEGQYETNLLGVIRTTKYFLPLLKKSGKGQIINISSVSGFFGFPGMGPYCSSKFALEGFSESLRLELLTDGIYVSLVEPASFKTSIWEKGLAIGDKIKEEEYIKQNAFQFAKQASENAGNPLEVAVLVRDITKKSKPKFRYRVGKGANSLWFIKKVIPWTMIEKIVLRRLMDTKKG